jgi:lipid-binding SYLF domain-containing protein
MRLNHLIWYLYKNKLNKGEMYMYIINTDMGYFAGELHNGVKFVEQKDARRFTYDELATNKDDFFNDLKKYYCVEEYQIEYIIENN